MCVCGGGGGEGGRGGDKKGGKDIPTGESKRLDRRRAG